MTIILERFAISAISGVAEGFCAPVAHDGLPIGAGKPATADLAYRDVYSRPRESILDESQDVLATHPNSGYSCVILMPARQAYQSLLG